MEVQIMTTEQIAAAYKETGLKDKTAITIQVAFEKLMTGSNCAGLSFAHVKREMPDLIRYILPDHLKYAGIIRLNNKGIELATRINKQFFGVK